MKNLKKIREEHGAGEWGTPELTKKYQNETPGQQVDEAQDYHAAALSASDHAKKSPSASTHKAASDAHEKAIAWHERKIASLIKKDSSSEEVKKHEDNIRMHKNQAQKHRFSAHRLNKSQQNEGTVTETNWKVTFKHKHPDGEKEHSYTVSAPHQNAADKKAIELHRKAHPKGDFHMWNSEELYEEGLKDACWKGYEAIGMKMKNGKKVPNCVPKEGAAEDAAAHHQAAHAALAKGDAETYNKELDKKFAIHSAEAEKNAKKPVKTFESPTTIEKPVAEESDEQKNLKITKHEKAAVEAGKRGDMQAQQYHLAIVKKMQNESVNEAKEEEKMQKHLVTVTVTDPQHVMSAKRKEKILKRVKVSAADPKDAVKKAEAHYKKHGFKVHDSLHHSVVAESLDTDEIVDAKEEPSNDKQLLSMARGQLSEIADMAQELVDSMDETDDLEPWMNSKITTAYVNLDDVHSFIAYGDEYTNDNNPEEKKDKLGEATGEVDPEEKAQITKIQTLIRLGLLDISELPIAVRVMKKLAADKDINIIDERKVLIKLISALMDRVTEDDMVYRRVRTNIAQK